MKQLNGTQAHRRMRAASILLLACVSQAGIPSAQAAGAATPTASIAAPLNGAVVSGNVTVKAVASGHSPVTAVQFLLDGEVVSSDASRHYSYVRVTTETENGAHTLQAKAFDADGSSALSAPVRVMVRNEDWIARCETFDPSSAYKCPAFEAPANDQYPESGENALPAAAGSCFTREDNKNEKPSIAGGFLTVGALGG